VNFGNRGPSQPPLTGSVSVNLNNSALNAAPFSLNGQNIAKGSSNRIGYTSTIGGPMVIPKLLNWQRASFNVTYQGTVSRSAYNGVGTVPTQAERGGDFSQLLTGPSPTIIYDPTTHLPFVGNIIPPTQLDKAALGLLNYFPDPRYSGIAQNYQLSSSTPNDNQNLGVRLNAPLTNKDRLTFNIQFQSRSSASQQLFGFRDTGTGTGLSAALGWSHSFGRRFNNSANLTLSRNNNKSAPFFAYSNDIAAQLGIAGTSQDPINFGPPNLSFTNFSGLNDGSASVTRNQTINFTDNITYVVQRKHNLTFGFGYRRLQQNSLTYQNARGSYSFSGLLTSALDANGQPVKGTGYDFADFLLGLPQSSSVRFGSDNNYFRSWAANWFAQDDYRLSRSMTLNVGLRYEYFAPYTELQGHLANLDVAPGFTAVSVVTPGEAGPYSGAVPTSLVRSEPNNYSPRFGFAWRPWTKDSLVIRSGYSIFYSGSPYSTIASQMASQPPFANTASLSTSLTNPLTIENGFLIPPSQITNTYAINPNYKLAYAQTWNFTIQHNLPHAVVLEVEYIGTKGTDLSMLEQPNRALPGSSPLTSQQQLQIGNATAFNYQTYGGNSIFNAGQTRVTRRFTRGMSATVLYTYSKSIDDASSFNGTGGTTIQYINNWGLERGLSSTDQRHRMQLDYTLSSPVGVNGMLRNGGWKEAALAGWTMTGTFIAASGTPLTATVAGNQSNTGGIGALGGSVRAEATGLPITGGSNPYFNTLAFTTPPPGQFGNAGKDTIPGPFQTSFNASINRAFRFGESRRQLQLRLSATNALNHVVITNFGTTVGSLTYGLATNASATRTVTLMLRFGF
jgi:trimeric autotransporter adhesin